MFLHRIDPPNPHLLGGTLWLSSCQAECPSVVLPASRWARLFLLGFRRGLTSRRNNTSLLQMGSFSHSSKTACGHGPGAVLGVLGGKLVRGSSTPWAPAPLLHTLEDSDLWGTEDKMRVATAGVCAQIGLLLVTWDTSQCQSSGLFDNVSGGVFKTLLFPRPATLVLSYLLPIIHLLI